MAVDKNIIQDLPFNKYISIDKVAELKGLKSNRSIRIEINKPDSKYISRKVKVKGGFTYEILVSSLEPEIQSQLVDESIKSTQLVPLNNGTTTFAMEKHKLEAHAKVDLIHALYNFRTKFKTKKQADKEFLELYNSGEYLKKIFQTLGKISKSTLYRYIRSYEENGTAAALIPKYKNSRISEYKTNLTPEMINVFLKFLLHENKFNIGKAISLTRYILEKQGYENIPCEMTFRRYAYKYRKLNYDKWVLHREGEKAFNDKVEPYIERDASLLEAGEVLIADGHTLNFQVINPFTGKPQRATLVGFLDWKSTALVGYEIMMSENTQCIASALRNAVLNLGRIPKIVYQDNGRAFRAKYFQNCNFEESGFNGVYANLGIKSVFAKVRNAKAKVIERFFREFQEEFEKMMISYTGTSIQDKPARLMRGEKLHKEFHKRMTNNRIPTVQEVIKLIDCWLEYHNSKPCPNDRSKTIQEILNTVQKQDIDKNILNDLMMKTETKFIHRNGIRFLGTNYYNESLFGLREPVYVRYSLFDLSKVYVYSLKGEFLCAARQVTKTHPMANHLGSVTDMEDFKQKIQKQKRLKNKAVKEYKKYFPDENTEVLETEPEPIIEIEEFKEIKQSKPKKLTPREQQMNRPFFNSDYEKYEWLMSNGCTNQDDRQWLAKYIRSDEYLNLYED